MRDCFDGQDLEGLGDTWWALAAASVYMYGNLSKPAAAAATSPSALVFTMALVGDHLFLVGAVADLVALVKSLFCKTSMLAAAAPIVAFAVPVAPVGDFVFLVGAFADLLSLMAALAAAFTG